MMRSLHRWPTQFSSLRFSRKAVSSVPQAYFERTITHFAAAPYVDCVRYGPVPSDAFDQSWSRVNALQYGSNSSLFGLKRLPAKSTSATKPSAEPGYHVSLYGQFGPQAT